MAELPYYDTHKLRENGIRGFEVFLSYGQGELPLDFSMESWKRKSLDFLEDVFGKENVAAATLQTGRPCGICIQNITNTPENAAWSRRTGICILNMVR